MTFLHHYGRLRRIVVAAFLSLASGLTLGAGSGAASLTSSYQPAAQQSSDIESPLPVFELHSGFWVNLHHFLYLQARLAKGTTTSGSTTRGAAPPDMHPVSLLDFPADQIRAWQAAVDFYGKDLVGRDLLLNGDMENINNQLSEMETCPDLEGKNSALCKSGLRKDLVETLELAAPVYRAHWWADQDRDNRQWIAQVAPIVRQMGVELSGQLAEIYQRPWPTGRLRVDVVSYGGPYGAYTSLNPLHITISSRDARNQGLYGFEVLFHESSHALAGAVNQAIAREFRDRDKPIPRDLWHALLFYTTGELVRRDLAYGTTALALADGADPSSYKPYAARFGLYSGSWEKFRSMLDLYWQPYLDGKVSFDSAIARLASAM